jgi:hypothetical protein
MRNVTRAAIATIIILSIGTTVFFSSPEWGLDASGTVFLILLFVYGIPISCGLLIYQELKMNADRHTGSMPWITVTVVAVILASYALFMYWLWNLD